MTLEERSDELDRILLELGSLLVAYSGGVDSALLAARAHRLLGERSLAVTADSWSLAEEQRSLARRVAAQFGFRHLVIPTREFENPLYVRNHADRCYHCKSELFSVLVPLARAEGLAHVAYGLIVDDLGDFRPGHRAALAAGIRSPLAEAGLGKEEVRALSRQAGLPTAELPASPCLSSRVPHGTPVGPEILGRVERAEAALKALGFRELRVRHHGEEARVEISSGELPRLADPELRRAAVSGLERAGYSRVLFDPAGYRRGRLNEPTALRVVS